MSKRDRQLRYNLLLQQLELIRRYWKDFEKRIGSKKGLEQYIDKILDEMIELRNYKDEQ